MKLKKINFIFLRNILIIVILILMSGCLGYFIASKKSKALNNAAFQANIINKEVPTGKEVDFSLFWDVWNRLERNFVDKSKLNTQQMVYGAISGMVASVGDPYTVFLPPKEQKEAKEELGGTFEGIGAQLGMKDNRIIVVAPLKGMPAETAGIKSGDWIVKVESLETAGWSVQEAVNKIRGPKGTPVVLAILHEGEQKPVDISIIRGTILVKSAEWDKTYWKSDNGRFKKDDSCTTCASIAHLRLSRFGDQTNNEWNQAITEIKNQLDQGLVEGVVLDLRNNPGGYLQGAVFIASEFIKEGQVIVQQEYSDGKKETYSVTRAGKLLKEPLVVLINKGSASASEIVAGALRDYDRAKLVGEKSFGKGSIQEAQDLPGGAGIHITIAKWLLPKGDWINSKGVEPQYNVALDEKDPSLDTQLEEASNLIIGI